MGKANTMSGRYKNFDSKNKFSISREELKTAIEKYLAEGNTITKIKDLPDICYFPDYTDVDNFLQNK